jgi:hypothetical protein
MSVWKPDNTTVSNHSGILYINSDALKLYELAIKINNNELIEIDIADLKLIEEAIKNNQKYNNLVKGSILKEIECQRLKDNKKDK